MRSGAPAITPSVSAPAAKLSVHNVGGYIDLQIPQQTAILQASLAVFHTRNPTSSEDLQKSIVGVQRMANFNYVFVSTGNRFDENLSDGLQY